MIEKISGKDEMEKKTTTLFRMPKNIRQIGQINHKKIYIEDYVMTYIRQLGSETENVESAVLLGRTIKTEEEKCLFISGAIEIEKEKQQEMLFTDEIWNYIYETKKQYFPELEIVGWTVMKPGQVLEPSEQMEKVHIDNFAGQDKVLLLYEPIEREESFYLFEGKHLKRQSGYFIYYEKNEVMQEYMLEHKEDRADTELVDDRATKEIRKIFAKKNESKAKRKKRNAGFIFASGTVVAATIVLLGISSNKNNQFLETMFQNLVQEPEQKEDTQTTSVETITADEITIKGETIVGDKSNETTKEAGESSESAKTGETTEENPSSETIKTGETTEESQSSKNTKTGETIEENQSSESTKTGETAEENQSSEMAKTGETTAENKNSDNTNGISQSETEEGLSENGQEPTSNSDLQNTNSETNPLEETMNQNVQKIEYYIVKKGDTLVSISRDVYHNNTYVEKIKEANALEDADKIYIGQRLIMPQ